MCKKLLCLNPVATENVGDNAEKSKGNCNAYPNNQSHTESEMAITNFSAMNPCHLRKARGKPFCAITNQHLALSW